MIESADSSAAGAAKKTSVNVRHGIQQRAFEGGTTVGDARKKYQDMFNIPKDAKAFSGNTELSDDTLLSSLPGDGVLEFIKKSGEKGTL